MKQRGFNVEHAVLRGLIEHQDAGYFFGSTSALGVHIFRTINLGWITADHEVTCTGHNVYTQYKMDKLPQSRWYFWKR